MTRSPIDAPTSEATAATLAAGADAALGETELAAGADVGNLETLASDAAGAGVTVTAETEGRYRILRELAAGGQSRVFVAYDTHLGREIAFKEPRTAPAAGSEQSREVLARFLREARITARLEHPNIVPIYEIGQRQDGSYYCAQKLIRSGSGKTQSRTLRLALEEADSLEDRLRLLPHFLDLCHAVAYAHEQGVIHRDLKPENVVIGRLGETVLLDWGLAKAIGEPDDDAAGASAGGGDGASGDDGATVAGFAFGTPSYMSPEQARGEVERIDDRSDIFSLGAILHELLTGRPPFVGKTALEIIERAATAHIAPIRGLAPPALAAVAHKALASDPDDRYQRAADLADDIGAYDAGLRVGVYRYSVWELVRLFVARHRALAAISLFAMLLLALSSGIAWRNYHRAEVYLGDARENLAHAFVEKARDAERQLQWDRAAAYYAAARAQADLPMARWGAMLTNNRARLEFVRLHAHAGGINDMAFSPDGGLMATTGADGTLAVVDVASREELIRATAGAALYGLAFSPDAGAIVTAGQDGHVRLWSLPTLEPTPLYEHHEEVNAVAFSPDGARLAIGTSDARVIAVDLERDELVFELELPGNPIYGLRYTPDGSALAVGGWDGVARMIDASTGASILEIAAHAGAFTLDISPDGELLATGGRDRLVKLWRVSDGSLVHQLEGHRERLFGVRFSPDGLRLGSVGADQTVRLWSVLRGHLLIGESFGTDGHATVLAFSPDGASVAWAGERVWLRRLADAPGRGRSRIVSLAVSPDGSLLAHGFKGAFFFIDTDRRESTKLGPAEVARRTAVFSADGQSFAGNCQQHEVCVWDVPSRELRATVRLEAKPIGLAYAPDKDVVAVGTDQGTISIWDVEGPALLHTIEDAHRSDVFSLAFSADGEHLASAGYDGEAILWDADSWQLVRRLRGHTHGIRRVRFSPDDRHVASASWDRTVRLWDRASGAELHAFEGHSDFVFDVAFDPHQRFLVSGSWDGTLRIWDLETRRELAAFVSDEARVYAVAVLPSGREVVYAGDSVRFLELNEPGAPDAELLRVLTETGLALRGIELERVLE
jgi:eukaryotic-like serine/threonine-protein kinase